MLTFSAGVTQNSSVVVCCLGRGAMQATSLPPYTLPILPSLTQTHRSQSIISNRPTNPDCSFCLHPDNPIIRPHEIGSVAICFLATPTTAATALLGKSKHQLPSHPKLFWRLTCHEFYKPHPYLGCTVGHIALHDGSVIISHIFHALHHLPAQSLALPPLQCTW